MNLRKKLTHPGSADNLVIDFLGLLLQEVSTTAFIQPLYPLLHIHYSSYFWAPPPCMNTVA